MTLTPTDLGAVFVVVLFAVMIANAVTAAVVWKLFGRVADRFKGQLAGGGLGSLVDDLGGSISGGTQSEPDEIEIVENDRPFSYKDE